MAGTIYKITVQYVGEEDFVDEVHGDPPFKTVKLAAMKKFELEESAAKNYVLQYGGTDLDDKKHVSSLGLSNFTLTLTLIEEPTKG